MNYLLVFFVIVAYKVISNLIKLLKLKFYDSEYVKFLADKPNHIEQYKIQTIQLFKNAGIKEEFIPISQPTGYGRVANVNASLYINFPSNIQVFAAPTLCLFDNAIGIYRSRVLESFSPLYWVDALLFLPKNILLYIGLDTEKVTFKLCNVILSSIWWFVGAAFLFFKTELLDFSINFLGNLK